MICHVSDKANLQEANLASTKKLQIKRVEADLHTNIFL
jgi:hypothetical protein